jgi:undecaprenyl-diphosphatase
MSMLNAILLAILQGVTELFPISSLGHAVIIPDLLNWPIDLRSPTFLPFLVVMHFGTAVALLAYFWRDWRDFGLAVVFNQGPRAAQERRLFFRVVVATIPAVIIGAVLNKAIRDLFADPVWACGFLIVNGVMLFGAERLKRSETRKSLDELSWSEALIIGCWQCLAFMPGISRSGSTMVGGFLSGLNHEDSARFSFLTGTPIIVAATVLEAPKLLKHAAPAQPIAGAAAAIPPIDMTTAIVAGIVAGITAFASLWALMHWLKRHEFRGFDPFAYYCMAFGALFLGLEILT